MNELIRRADAQMEAGAYATAAALYSEAAERLEIEETRNGRMCRAVRAEVARLDRRAISARESADFVRCIR